MIKPKTKRRVIYLVLATVVLGLLAGGAVGVRMYQIRATAAAMRQEGLTAFEKGDYPTAVDRLGRSMRRYSADPLVLFPLAQALEKVPQPNGRHLLASVQFLRRLLAIDPEHIEARRQLLRLYTDLNYSTEAVEAADSLLQQHPQDLIALRAMARGLASLRRFDEALPYAQRSIALEPLNLEMQVLCLSLLDQCGRNNEVIATAEKQLESRPEDGRFQLLLAMAYSIANDWTGAEAARGQALALRLDPAAKADKWDRPAVARVLLKKAAETVPPDAYYVQVLVMELDRGGMFGDATSLLQRTQLTDSDPWLRRLLVRRLWENGQHADVDRALASLKPEDPNSDVELLAFRAMALAALGKKDEAAGLADILAKREGNKVAAGWVAIIRHLLLPAEPKPLACIEPLHLALEAQRNSPHLRYFLGECYMQLGEHEQALELFVEVYAANQSWPAPLMRISRLLVETGQREQGLAAAELAWQRSPQSLAYVTNLATVFAANLKADDQKRSAQLLDLVTQVQKALPGEEQTLPIYILLLAKSGQRETAEEAAQAALGSKTTLKQSSLLQLAGISREVQLGVEEEYFRLAEKTYGLSPELGYARAVDAMQKGRAAEGLALLDAALAKAEPAQSVPWRLMRARYLEQMKDSRALEAWISLADDPALAGNLAVQREALRSAAAQADRALVGRTIDRLRKLTGDRAAGWRVARVRWLLQENAPGAVTPAAAPTRTPDNAAIAEAVRLMKEAAEAVPNDATIRQLYAAALERSGAKREAVEQLAAAARLAPASNAITLELARMYQAQGDFPRAREQLDRIALDALSPVQRRQVVALLAQQGDSGRALELLRDRPQAAVDPTDGLYMVELYRRRNQFQQAEELLNDLLKKPELTTIQVAADFFAAQGRKDEAERALAKLADLAPEPGQAEFIRAQYEARHDTPEKALVSFQRAATAAPANARFAEALVQQLLRMGRVAEALDAANQASQAPAAAPGLAALRKHAQVLQAAASEPALLPLIASMISSPDSAEAAASSLRILVDAAQSRQPTAATLAQLRPLADAAPDLLPLQRILIDRYLQIGKAEDAVGIATRCMRSAPSSPELAQLSAEVFAAAGNWRQALAVGMQWRELTLSAPIRADLFIAEMHLRLEDGAAALARLQPYLAAAMQAPESNLPVLALHARALIQRKEHAKAGEALWPHVSKSSVLRKLWLDLASAIDDPAAAGAWIERIVPAVAPALEEQFALADAWYRAGMRFESKPYLDRARTLLDTLLAKNPVPEVIFARAVMYEKDADVPAAETAYRRVLAAVPTHIVAKNNLAMILARRGGDMTEALNLATSAVAAYPRLASLHDTLGFVQLKAADFKNAAGNFRNAIALNPDELEFRVNLLEALLGANDKPDAKRILAEIDSLLPLIKKVPFEHLKRIEAARAALVG